MLCTVHDISLKGMRVTTDLVKHIVKDEMIKASIVLDDEPHTRLEMPARIRRVTPEQNRLTLGVEFLPTARQEDVLGSYVSS
jgi:PilZ domain